MQPPQNPYSQPGYGQPQNPYGGPVGQQPRGTVSLDVIGEAWNLVKPSLGQWIVAVLVIGVILVVVSFVVGLIAQPFAPRTPGTRPGAAFYLMTLVSQLLNAAVQGVGMAALFRMGVSQIRTGSANLNEAFGVFSSAGSIIVAAILVYLATIVGAILCIVPGIIAALGLVMTPFLVFDQNMAPVDAMKRSWEVMKNHLGSYFVLGLVLGLLNLAGALVCGLGLFVTVPIYFVAIALVYRDLFGTGGPVMPNSGYTPPPIANPNF